jgi:cell shape-determining protein MreC
MKNTVEKIINFLLIIVGIVFTISDILHQNEFENKRISIENYISLNSTNIDNILSKLYSFKYILFSYINDIEFVNNILEENHKLNNEITILKHKINTNEYFAKIKNEELYKQFELILVEIMGQSKNYGIISNKENRIKKDDIIINECGVIGKIAYNGNQVSIAMLAGHPKFLIPIKVGESNNTGTYSFAENKIIDIKDSNALKIGEPIISFNRNIKIPNGILIGRIVKIENKNIQIERTKCDNQKIGFLLIGK